MIIWGSPSNGTNDKCADEITSQLRSLVENDTSHIISSQRVCCIIFFSFFQINNHYNLDLW